MKKRGFTMIELLTVISIIAILASILFPVFARAREAARRSNCASNLSQIGVALNAYAQNYDGRYPRKNNDFAPLYRSVGSVDVFFCPSDSADRRWDFKRVERKNREPSSWDYEDRVPIRTYSSYVYKGGMSNDERADRVIAGESRDFHGGWVNVLYIGGHVKSVNSDNYAPVVPQTKKPVNEQVRPPSSHPAPGAPPVPAEPDLDPAAPPTTGPPPEGAPGAAPAPRPPAEPKPGEPTTVPAAPETGRGGHV